MILETFIINNVKRGLFMEKKKRIPELERGIGTTILNEIAERYDGEYRTERKEGLFCADVILKNKESGSC